MEWIADALLDKVLGRYVWLGERKFDFGRGTLVLKDVSLREDVLDGLGLPVALRSGTIGELKLTVPWTRLHSQSVVVEVHRLALLLAPHAESVWNADVERRNAAARKARKLAELRSAARAGGGGAAGGGAGERNGWVERLIDRVLDNLELVVTSAVLRYEDFSSSSEPFALEVAMDSLWLHPSHVTA